MYRSMSFIGAALVAALALQGASAAPVSVTRQTEVRYGDLDLGSPAGRATLQARVEQAAAKVCGGNPVFHTNYRDAPSFVRADFEQCRAAAEAQSEKAFASTGVHFASR